MGIEFKADLELVSRGNGYAMRSLSLYGRDFMLNYVDEYETAEKALAIVSIALKRKLKVAINIPITAEAHAH